uniref:Zinc finger RNA-binding protein n=1 Tax=Schistocephalus solidus TaxID=70667 RepID=A0A0X3PYC5_SCHSO
MLSLHIMQYYRPRQPYPTVEASDYLPPPNVSPLSRGRAPPPYRGPDMFPPGDSYPRFPPGGPIYRTPSPVHPSQQPHPSMHPSSGPMYESPLPDSPIGYGMSGRSSYPLQSRPNRGFPSTPYSPSPRLKRPYPMSAQSGGFHEKPKKDAPPAPPQLYCELCKISCVGQACLDAHMAGQKHKKRAVQQEALKRLGLEPGSTGPGKLLSELKCALCDIICTGADTYQAHIIGKQHQRTLRLHKALGKPVPECELPLKASTSPTATDDQKPVESELKEASGAAVSEKKPVTPASENPPKTEEQEICDDCIELVTSGHGLSFRCQLCNCFFTDLHAKDLHLKGKRHQTQLRKLHAPPPLPTPERARPQPWVRPPQLGPPPIPGLNGSAAIAWGPRLPKMNGSRPAGVGGGVGVGYNEGFFIPPYSFSFPSYFGPGGHISSIGDLRYMHTKLRQVMPTDAETEMIRLSVTACESALKQINDAKKFAEEEQEALSATAAKEQKTESEGGEEKQGEETTTTKPSPKKVMPPTPPFRGVFRVGALATGLLLSGDRKADLVLVCNRWPTTDDIVEIGGELESLVKESRKQYVVTVSPQPEDGVLLVHFSEGASTKSVSTEKKDDDTQSHMSVSLRIFFTSFRALQLAGKTKQPQEAGGNFENEDGAGDQEEEEEEKENTQKKEDDEDEHLGEALPCSSSSSNGNNNCLPKKLCIDALTEVRRAVWLQAVLSTHPVACVLVNVVRVVRNLMLHGIPDKWGQLSEYTLTLLLERLSCLDMGPTQPGSSTAPINIRVRPPLLLRRMLEAFASGILLPGFQLYKLMDPSCTSPPQYLSHLPPEARGALPEVDLLANLSLADRELTTRTAQLSLRLLSFRQIYKVLGVEKFVPQQRPIRDQEQKRKADTSSETDVSVSKVPKVDENVQEKAEEAPRTLPSGGEKEALSDGGDQT